MSSCCFIISSKYGYHRVQQTRNLSWAILIKDIVVAEASCTLRYGMHNLRLATPHRNQPAYKTSLHSFLITIYPKRGCPVCSIVISRNGVAMPHKNAIDGIGHFQSRDARNTLHARELATSISYIPSSGQKTWEHQCTRYTNNMFLKFQPKMNMNSRCTGHASIGFKHYSNSLLSVWRALWLAAQLKLLAVLQLAFHLFTWVAQNRAKNLYQCVAPLTLHPNLPLILRFWPRLFFHISSGCHTQN